MGECGGEVLRKERLRLSGGTGVEAKSADATSADISMVTSSSTLAVGADSNTARHHYSPRQTDQLGVLGSLDGYWRVLSVQIRTLGMVEPCSAKLPH